MKGKLYFIVGCTACGKGALGRHLAGLVSGQIVSVDSMKVYRRMDIGTAKPSPEARAAAPHHCIDIVEPSESFSVAQYVEHADRAIESIRSAGDILLAVGGTYFVQAGELSGEVLFASIPVGLTVTAILNVNNVRDIDTDREAGKRTLAVRLGRPLARAQYVVTVVAAYLVAGGLWLVGDFPPFVLLAWLTLPLAIAPVRAVMHSEDGPTLNGALRSTARLHLVFAVLLAIGVTL